MKKKRCNALHPLYLVLCMLVSGRILVEVGGLAAHQACRSCCRGEVGLSTDAPGGDARQCRSGRSVGGADASLAGSRRR